MKASWGYYTEQVSYRKIRIVWDHLYKVSKKIVHFLLKNMIENHTESLNLSSLSSFSPFKNSWEKKTRLGSMIKFPTLNESSWLGLSGHAYSWMPHLTPRNEPGDSPSVMMCRAPRSSFIFVLSLLKWSGFWPSSEGESLKFISSHGNTNLGLVASSEDELHLWKLGTWLCFQQGPYFIAHFWEYALKTWQWPTGKCQSYLLPEFSSLSLFHHSMCLTPVALITPGLKSSLNPLSTSWMTMEMFSELSGLHASFTCCCGVLSSRRFHPSATG